MHLRCWFSNPHAPWVLHSSDSFFNATQFSPACVQSGPWLIIRLEPGEICSVWLFWKVEMGSGLAWAVDEFVGHHLWRSMDEVMCALIALHTAEVRTWPHANAICECQERGSLEHCFAPSLQRAPTHRIS